MYPAPLSAVRLAVTAAVKVPGGVVLYPNPASGSFRLKFNAALVRIVVYDVLGRAVISSKVVCSNQAIDISHLKEDWSGSSSVYPPFILRLLTEDKRRINGG